MPAALYIGLTAFVGVLTLWYPPRAPGWAADGETGWLAWAGADMRRVFRIGLILHLLSSLAVVGIQHNPFSVYAAIQSLASPLGYFGRLMMVVALARWTWLPEGTGDAAVTYVSRKPCSRARHLFGLSVGSFLVFTVLSFAAILTLTTPGEMRPDDQTLLVQNWMLFFAGPIANHFSVLVMALGVARLVWPPAASGKTATA